MPSSSPWRSFEYLALLRRQFVEYFAHLVGQDAPRHLLVGRENFVVFDKVAERRLAVAVIIAHGVLERDGVLIYLFYLIDLLDIDAHLKRYLFGQAGRDRGPG